jgi:acyl-CoA synthetase (AMP-forming)/AMP-acid ligase II
MSSAFPPQWVRSRAERDPEAPAVDSPDHRLTYGALALRVRDLAGHLAERGVTAGDRVLVALPTSPAAVVAALAVQALGACAVEIDRGLGRSGFATVLRQIQPRFAVLAAQDAHPWASALRDGELDWIWTLGAVPAGAAVPARGITDIGMDGALAPAARGLAPPPAALAVEGSPALVLFTSGSTGQPRGVIQTFRNLAANTRSIVEYLGLGADDRAMLILPFHYCYGRSVLQTHLYAGGSCFLDPRFMYPRVVMEAIGSEGCTGFAGVPLTFEILRREVDLRKIRMPRLRYVTQAGGAMRTETIRWAREAFAPARFFVMYGQTEATSRLAYLPPERGEEKMGSIGIAIPGVELRVVDDAGRELPPGEVGHLVARGENVTPGYHDAPEETASILHGGWLWTGDLGRRDEDGFLYVVGRAREILKVGGQRVSPLEIEGVVAEHPAVADVAVVGTPDEVQGDAVVAFVVLRPGMSVAARDIRRFCRERVSASKVPSVVEVIDVIPRNASGKPLKPELAERARAAHRRGLGA